MAIFLSSYNIFNYALMHLTDCKFILNKNESMKDLWNKEPKEDEDVKMLQRIEKCIVRNSVMALSTCFISAIFVLLIAKYVTMEPLDAGLIIHEKAFNISSNMTHKIRQIMSVTQLSKEISIKIQDQFEINQDLSINMSVKDLNQINNALEFNSLKHLNLSKLNNNGGGPK